MGGDTTELIPRVGVFICDCGDKIAGALDTEALRQQVGALPGSGFCCQGRVPLQQRWTGTSAQSDCGLQPGSGTDRRLHAASSREPFPPVRTNLGLIPAI